MFIVQYSVFLSHFFAIKCNFSLLLKSETCLFSAFISYWLYASGEVR